MSIILLANFVHSVTCLFIVITLSLLMQFNSCSEDPANRISQNPTIWCGKATELLQLKMSEKKWEMFENWKQCLRESTILLQIPFLFLLNGNYFPNSINHLAPIMFANDINLPLELWSLLPLDHFIQQNLNSGSSQVQ